jgi:hypothetical protein
VAGGDALPPPLAALPPAPPHSRSDTSGWTTTVSTRNSAALPLPLMAAPGLRLPANTPHDTARGDVGAWAAAAFVALGLCGILAASMAVAGLLWWCVGDPRSDSERL